MTEHTHKQPMRAHRIYENAAALGACEAERDQLKALNAQMLQALRLMSAAANWAAHESAMNEVRVAIVNNESLG